MPSNISTAAYLAASVQVSGLDFLSDGSYADTIATINEYPSKISEMIYDAENVLIISCIQNGDTNMLVQYVNEGKISTETLLKYSSEYMTEIMYSGNINTYNSHFKSIGGKNGGFATANDAIAAMGFDDKFIYNLSNEYCRYLINNDLMYTREGTVEMAKSFTGLLSIFGVKLGYDNYDVHFDKSYDGFYFGTGEEGARELTILNCCNYVNWLARCSGIDISWGGPWAKFEYADDGYTPEDEWFATAKDEYYTKARGGDWLHTPSHIMTIVENDGKGYYFAEDDYTAEINYMTYEELSNKGYRVTNTDALYRNTASPHTDPSRPWSDEYIWLNEDGSINELNKILEESVPTMTKTNSINIEAAIISLQKNSLK